MKRRLLPVFLMLFLLPFALKAQNDFYFADSTSVWHLCQAGYTEGPFGISSSSANYTYQIERKISINNFSYQKIIPGYLGSPAYIRKDSTGKVFLFDWDSQTERMIYDFGANVGDTITLHFSTFWNNNESVMLLVDSVDTVTHGTPRKRMFLTCISDDNCFWRSNDIWIEGIGSLISHFLSPMIYENYWIPGQTFLLLGYEENGMLYNFSAGVCIVGIHETQTVSSSHIKISPNPTTQTLNISTLHSNHQIQNISLTNLNGKQLLQTTATQIPVSHLAKGLYFVAVEFTNGEILVRKVVVE